MTAAHSTTTIPTIVLGGSGYVAGELLRLLADHPILRVAGVVSTTQAGEPVESTFPHLRDCYPDFRFTSRDDLCSLVSAIAVGGGARQQAADMSTSSADQGAPRTGVPSPTYSGAVAGGGSEEAGDGGASDADGGAPGKVAFQSLGNPQGGGAPGAGLLTAAAGGDLAIFSAAPHGASAPLIDEILHLAAAAGLRSRVVDLSADFRYASVIEYARVYGHTHGAPVRLSDFTCALPEHLAHAPTEHIAHPGCFVTAVLLAAVPLLRAGLIEPDLFVSAVTGSTGAGRTLTATTHHPERRSNLFAYQPLTHRHQPEMRALAKAASGVGAAIHFVPHAGPFARGIHMTLGARTARRISDPISSQDARAALAAAYADAPFVEVVAQPPRLQDVVGTNRCLLHVEVRDGTLVALAVLDNLVKGAAGGGVQWMNRLLGIPETTGLRQPGLGWI